MNPEALRKVLPLVMIALMGAQMTKAFLWMLRMGLGEVYGLPADIVLVLTVLDVALFSYVTVQMVRNGFDTFWLVSPEGSMTWKLFMAVMVIDLLIPVFEKATELV